MKYIYERIDKLMQKCERCQGELTYREIIYELDELLASLVGKKHNSYENFINVVHSQSGYISNCYALKGVLQGIKNHLAIVNKNKCLYL